MHSTNLSAGLSSSNRNNNNKQNHKTNSLFKTAKANGNGLEHANYSNVDLNALNSRKSSFHKSPVLGAQLISSQLKGMSSSMIDQIAKGNLSISVVVVVVVHVLFLISSHAQLTIA